MRNTRLSDFGRDLLISIEFEISLYEKYLALMKDERASIIKSRSEEITSLSTARQLLIDQMKEAQEVRVKRIGADICPEGSPRQQIISASQVKLRDYVRARCSKEDLKLVLPRAEHLYKLVKKTSSKNRELNQVVGFSLKMISGLVSILWSSTKNVVRSYTSTGNLKESTHPTQMRSEGILKKV